MAQQAGDCITPDYLHGVLLKEDIAPDAVFNIEATTGDGQMNVRMLVELTAVGVQGTEDTDLNTLFTRPPEYGPGGSPEQGVDEWPVIVEEGPQQMGHLDTALTSHERISPRLLKSRIRTVQAIVQSQVACLPLYYYQKSAMALVDYGKLARELEEIFSRLTPSFRRP